MEYNMEDNVFVIVVRINGLMEYFGSYRLWDII
mgnify:CR=1 FL=1